MGLSLAILAPQRAPLTHPALQSFLDSTVLSLQDWGISPRHRIAAVLPNGPEAATAFLAFSRCSAFAPLNPGYTQRDFDFYLDDLKAAALLVPSGYEGPALASARAREIPLIRLETEPDEPAGLFRLQMEAAVKAAPETEASAALLLHTSGTTSRPKLVPLSTANLEASARNIARTLGLTPGDRCLNIMPLFHIHGLMAAVLASISSGASVVCTDGVYGNRFFDWLEFFKPTWYTAVPTMHQAILAKSSQHAALLRDLKLRFLRSSSASLAPALMEQLEEAFQAPLIEAYGMTEAAHQMASNPLPPSARKPGSVGPAAGPEIAIMDESGRLLACGERGEVVIRGANVTAGYLDNPEANLTAFVDGWFRTGDQGYLDADGYLHLSGRLKEIINRGGEKISPREIDEIMLTHPRVRQALAFAVPHMQLGEEVGVAIELKPGGVVSESELRRFAAGRLPAFKVPKVIRILDEIPKGPTGKLQRIGLSARLGIEALDEAGRRAPFIEPRSETERVLAGIWRRVLGVERAGAEDTVESLGGDSLLTVRLILEANQRYAVDLPFLEFLERRTLASMAAEIDHALANPSAPAEMSPIQIEGSAAPIFCVPGHDGVLSGLRRLATLLGGIPLWALQLPAAAEPVTVAGLGERLARCASRVQPEGPVRLLGFCFGGLVAYEAACCLEKAGRKVELLVLIDAFNPAWKRSATALERAAAFAKMSVRRVGPHLSQLASTDWRGRWEYLRTRAGAFVNTATERPNAYRQALGAYTPSAPLCAPALLFEMDGRRLHAPLLGWQRWLTGSAKLKRIPFETRGSLSARCAPLVARGLIEEIGSPPTTS